VLRLAVWLHAKVRGCGLGLWPMVNAGPIVTHCTCCCSFTGEACMIFRRCLHVDGLMRCRVTRDGRKMIISMTDGFIMVIHDLDLNHLGRDLFGFVPSNYYDLKLGRKYNTKPPDDFFAELFTARRNRVEIIDDFPMGDEPSMVPSLEVRVSVSPVV